MLAAAAGKVEPLELGAREVDPAGKEIRRDLDRALQELFGLAVVLGLHRDQREQPQRLDVLRVAPQDLAVDRLGLLELAGAMVLRRLGEQFARRIGAQEGLHGRLGLGDAAGIRERMHQRQAARTAASGRAQRAWRRQSDGFVGAAELQERIGRALRGPWRTAAVRRGRAAAAARPPRRGPGG